MVRFNLNFIEPLLLRLQPYALSFLKFIVNLIELKILKKNGK